MHDTTYHSISTVGGSRHSYETQDARSTAPTSIHSSVHYATDRALDPTKPSHAFSSATTYYARASAAETYASTLASQEDLVDEPTNYDLEYEAPEYAYNDYGVLASNIRPSTPSDFADFFPSARRMYIRHDDTTFDGNMNLRVDTEDSSSRARENVQLFHMRMHDLMKMEFSLRRYERSSGREVCHSKREYVKASADRKSARLPHSIGSALSSIVGGRPMFKRTSSGLSTNSSSSSRSTKIQDSGYDSGSEEDDEDDDEVEVFMSRDSKLQEPTNAIKLEFSNYAQVEIKRKGTTSSKRYEFEYWGYEYSWKRVIEKDGEGEAVSFHLFRNDNPAAVAHIVPEMLSPHQIRTEQAAGRWIPPCSMWISDRSILEAQSDVPDVVVATGLIALVDDCIKRRFHSKRKNTHHVSLPLTNVKMDIEFVSPKAMVEHMFQRRNSGGSTKEKEHRGSPLRYGEPVATC